VFHSRGADVFEPLEVHLLVIRIGEPLDTTRNLLIRGDLICGHSRVDANDHLSASTSKS
jgi:hypothetical protein